MSAVKLGAKSQERLNQVRADLKAVCYKAFETMPFDITITEGLRSQKRQAELFAQGATKVMTSRHMSGNAIDMCPYPVDYNDLDRFAVMAEHMFAAAKELGITIRWGGTWERQFSKPINWAKFLDAPHFELPA